MADITTSVPSYDDNLHQAFAEDRIQRSRGMAQWMIDARVEKDALQAGANAPDFALPDHTGRSVSLHELLAKGPVVIAFYRGSWCPYCNVHLRTYQQALPLFEALGASLVAISPQTPDNSLTIIEKNGLTFPVLTDANNEVASRFGLTFALIEETKQRYREMGNDLERYNANDRWELPVPGTFVIDRQGVIRLAHTPADYTQRLEPVQIIEALKQLS